MINTTWRPGPFARRRRLSRRAATAAVAAAVCASLFAGACRPAAESSGGGPQAPVRKLTIAVPRDSGPLNVYSNESSLDFLVELVYDKLLAPSPYVAAPMAGLAERATQLDATTWTVTLRDGVTWHDGRPFTADDVKFTYESYRDGTPNRHSHHVSAVPKIDRIVIDDPRTVRFVCGYPCPTLGPVTFADLPILPKHIWERITEPQTHAALPVGTGPYQLVEHRPDQLFRFRAHESYFMGRPLVDELVMPVIKDPNAMFTALMTGELDVAARDLPPELRPEIARQPAIKTIRTAPLSLIGLHLNFERVPFDQPEFRQAFSAMIDRQQIVETVLLGEARPGTQGMNHPDSPWTKPGLSTPFDRELARRLLDALEFVDRDRDGVRETPAGQPLAFTLAVASNEPVWIRAVELVAAHARAVGIRLTVQPLDPGTIYSFYWTRQFDIYTAHTGPHGIADPDMLIMGLVSRHLWNPEIPFPPLNSLIDEWKRAADVESRKQLSFKIQELFNRHPSLVALYYPTSTFAYRPAAYDNWVESPGFGIVHKWSFLPAAARQGAAVASRDR